MSVHVISRGARELTLRFDTFPARAHQKLKRRIEELTAELWERVESVVPHRTGKLASEIRGRVYGDQPERVAGYVSVRASDKREFPKAATLEYGTNKPRRIFARAAAGEIAYRMEGRRRLKMVQRMTRPVHIAAARYLRGPLEELRPEIEAALAEAMAEVTAEQAEGAAV